MGSKGGFFDLPPVIELTQEEKDQSLVSGIEPGTVKKTRTNEQIVQAQQNQAAQKIVSFAYMDDRSLKTSDKQSLDLAIEATRAFDAEVGLKENDKNSSGKSKNFALISLLEAPIKDPSNYSVNTVTLISHPRLGDTVLSTVSYMTPRL